MAVHRVVIHYPKQLIDAPLVSQMVKQYNLEFNLLRANITPQSEGLLVLGLEGAEGDIQSALAWARGQGLRVQPLDKDVTRDEARCTQCGACVTICPSQALCKDAQTQEVRFNSEECIACELCVPVCPPRAMEVKLL